MLRGTSGLLLALLTACAVPPPAVDAGVPAPLAPFLGEFAGTLQTFGERGVQQVPMRLSVGTLPGATDRWRWELHYGDGAAAQRRDYRLVAVDAAAGRYAIDEQNGIELAARLCGPELVSVFLVSGQALVVRYRAVADGIEFALESFAPERAAATGQGVRTVGSFAVQRALLRRLPAS